MAEVQPAAAVAVAGHAGPAASRWNIVAMLKSSFTNIYLLANIVYLAYAIGILA
jgi:hypothetical protein